MPTSKVHPVHPGNASYESLVLSMAPISYWPLGETDGTVMQNLIGSAGSYVASPTLGGAGPLARDSARAVALNGTTQYGNAGTLGGLSLNAMTLVAWIYADDTWADDHRCFFGVRNDGTKKDMYWFHHKTDSRIYLTFRDGVNAQTAGSTAAYTPNHSVWEMWSVAKIDTTVEFRVNTTQIATQNSPANAGIVTDSDIYVGARNYGGVGMTFDGKMCHLALFDSKLTAAQLASLYLVGINGA